MLERVELATVPEIGEYAFAYCRNLTDVVLNETITEIPQYAFAGCVALENINLQKIVKLGDYAFIEAGELATVDLSAAESIGEYAFVYCDALTNVKLSENGTDIGEGAFSYCEQLAQLENIAFAKHIGSYAFAYTAITEIDLSGAVSIDDAAFLKEELTPFRVTLGCNLETLGNNPFAMCLLEPFAQSSTNTFNGVDYTASNFSYQLSPNVYVIDGSLYCRIATGLELIAYAGTDPVDVKVADDTVRISAFAFAGSDVQMVTLPYTVASIGHKAFYLCNELETVVFNSYDAPILEEEIDSAYYESFEHIPGTGDYDSYEDYDGTQVDIVGEGIIPYYMWNITDGMYSNVFYGANFVDYVGYVEDKLTMVRPVNGKNYDSYIYGSYFDLTINGAAAADDVTLAAVAAIKAIPERVSYEDKALVEAARAAYTKIATTEQQALVTNYADLISAEQRITALTPTETEPVEETPTEEGGNIAVIVSVVAGVVILAGAAVLLLKKRKRAQQPAAQETAAEEETPAEPVCEEETTEEVEANEE